MGIINITVQEVGQVAQAPNRVKIVTTDNLATITTAGYLNTANLMGFTISPLDILDVVYSYSASTNNGTYEVFTISISNGVITLVAWANPGDVLLPVVSGDFATFNGTTGQIKDAGYVPSDATKTKVVMAGSAVVINRIAHFVDTSGTVDDTAAAVTNAGDIYAGLDAVAGVLRSYPATTATGYLGLTGVANSGAFNVQIANVAHGQSSIHSLPDPANAAARILVGATATPFTSGNFPVASGTGGLMVDSGTPANRLLFTSFASPDAAADLVAFDITVGQAALAAGGAVTLVTSSGSKQYKIRALWINSGGTNFSGGGGDRLGQVTDGTTVYSVVPATNMQTLINAGWGVSTPLPFPAATAINTSTVAGASLTFKYSGGTTDYTAGSIVVSGIAQRVA